VRIRQEDTVQVIAGKDKGKRGKVQRVMRKEGLVFVEGTNVVKKHVRPRPNVRQAGIVQMEAPLRMSKVMLVCNHCEKAVRVGQRFLEDGKKVRVCRSCQEVID
jgi:large subunit ribosomal protein L24